MYPYFTIFSRTIPTYGVCMTLGIVLCYLLAHRRVIRAGLSADHLLIICALTISCALAGAKLLYIAVTFSPAELWRIITQKQWTTLMEGGLVFYGGLGGGLLGAVLGAKIAGTPLLRFEHAIVPLIPLGYGFGRIGCFFAGCCYGFFYAGHVFPVQLLDAGISFVICPLLAVCAKYLRTPYSLLLLYLGSYAVQRFLLEFLRGDVIRGVYYGLSTSQWISLGLFTLCAAVIVRKRFKRTLIARVRQNETPLI